MQTVRLEDRDGPDGTSGGQLPSPDQTCAAFCNSVRTFAGFELAIPKTVVPDCTRICCLVRFALSVAKSASWMSLWAAVRLVTALVRRRDVAVQGGGLERAELAAKGGHVVQRLLHDLTGERGVRRQGRLLARSEFEEVTGAAAEAARTDILDADLGLLTADDIGAELEQGPAAQDLETIVSRGGDVRRKGEGRRVQGEVLTGTGALCAVDGSLDVRAVVLRRRRGIVRQR